jgi:glutamyl-tRNA reductase
MPWALVMSAGEAVAERRADLARLLEEMCRYHSRWALLVTCHRVEVYGFGPRPSLPMTLLEGEAAVRHLFRVAAGLESAVLGESEVLGQVREALAVARRRGVDERLARMLESAVAAGRAARDQPIRPHDGLAGRVVAWLGERADLRRRPLLVVGSGVMGSALVRAATAAGVEVRQAGHRPGRAALDLPGAAAALDEMAAAAVALRGPWSELDGVTALPPLADLSVPPAVPAEVRRRLGPDFLGIDQLWERVPEAGSASWVARAERAVEEGVDDYLTWLRGRRSVATLVALRERGEDRRRSRVERLLRRLPQLGQRERELVEQMSRQLVTDLLHEPMRALRADPDGSQAEAARRLFGL